MAPKSITPETAGSARNGADYLASIKDDGRQVYFDGDVVKDVTTHSAFKGAAKSFARLFDLAADPANAALRFGAVTKARRPPPILAHGG